MNHYPMRPQHSGRADDRNRDAVSRSFSVGTIIALLALSCRGETAASRDAGHADANADDTCDNGSVWSVSKNEVSSAMPTVGVVEWSIAGERPSSAKLVYRLKNAAASMLNQGGEAPVKLDRRNFRTLLLGLKQSSDYTFQIEATRNGATCLSPEYSLPTTGSYPNARAITVSVAQPGKREPGFIVTSSGTSVPSSAYIIDADGDLVWYADAPENPTRAQMDYEGENMWMISLNLDNWGGEVRYVSMDGERGQQNVPGLETAHHDFTVMPGGKVAALAWNEPGIDAQSQLLVRSPDGSVTRLFEIGNNLYQSTSFHANAIHYIPYDHGFTIADRNSNTFVKVGATGSVEWQLGGTCDQAPAGDRCSPRDWQVIHGHQLFEDGTFLGFNNGYTDKSHILEFKLTETPHSFTATLVRDYEGSASSSNMGDVQRLPGGNTLVTYSSDWKIVELDSTWNEVQTFSARVGYSSWRATLYGPPLRP